MLELDLPKKSINHSTLFGTGNPYIRPSHLAPGQSHCTVGKQLARDTLHYCGVGWSDLCFFWANQVLTCKGFLQITRKDHILKLLALKVKVAGKGQNPNFKGHEMFKNQKMGIKQCKFAHL